MIIETIINPHRKDWKNILKRAIDDDSKIENTVKEILTQVQTLGDKAVLEYTKKFDNPNIKSILVSDIEIQEAKKQVSNELKEAIDIAIKNIEKFHISQKDDLFVVETQEGVRCWRQSVAIQKVGLYIPGGTAPLFSTILMLAVPAQIAGCSEIVLCTPAGKNDTINPAILYAADCVGIKKIYKVGGAQAIAAMAYGTENIPQVYKIFGPGNQYVTKAKMLVAQQGIAIDMPAGPSEVMVVADKSAEPEFIAADLLSQCEHGKDSQAILLTNSDEIAKKTIVELEKQLEHLSRKELTRESLKYSKIIVMHNESDLIDLMNEYAAEHLILSVEEPFDYSKKVINAGSVFLGNYSPESVGDYASGTNHTLPTNGYSKAYSGVSLDSFVKKITFQQLNETGLQKIGKYVKTMAEAEELDAHKNAVTVRLNKINRK